MSNTFFKDQEQYEAELVASKMSEKMIEMVLVSYPNTEIQSINRAIGLGNGEDVGVIFYSQNRKYLAELKANLDFNIYWLVKNDKGIRIKGSMLVNNQVQIAKLAKRFHKSIINYMLKTNFVRK